MPQTQEVSCSGCTTTLRIPDKYWGKNVRCPKCKGVIAVPAGAAAPVPVASAEPALDDVDFLDDDPLLDDDAVDQSLSAPRVQKKSGGGQSGSKTKQAGGAFGVEKKMLGSGVLGGMGLMAGAVIWFVLGIVLIDRIFIYPPIMFIIGLVSFIKGLVNGG
jgi:ribosomal protein S27E